MAEACLSLGLIAKCNTHLGYLMGTLALCKVARVPTEMESKEAH